MGRTRCSSIRALAAAACHGARGSDGASPEPAPGNDVANVADGFGDRVFCGGGTDTVNADQFDDLASDCETVTRLELRAGGADVIAPIARSRR